MYPARGGSARLSQFAQWMGTACVTGCQGAARRVNNFLFGAQTKIDYFNHDREFSLREQATDEELKRWSEKIAEILRNSGK